jgi:hypothetical protein
MKRKKKEEDQTGPEKSQSIYFKENTYIILTKDRSNCTYLIHSFFFFSSEFSAERTAPANPPSIQPSTGDPTSPRTPAPCKHREILYLNLNLIYILFCSSPSFC